MKLNDRLLAIVGLASAIASVVTSSQVFRFVFFVVLLMGTLSILYDYFIKTRNKTEDMVIGDHPALYSMLDLMKGNENQNVIISKLIKNIEYTNNNRNSNVTYIINGEVIDDLCSGLSLAISGGATASNIRDIGYSLIMDEKNMINDDFHFKRESGISKIFPFKVKVEEIKLTNYARKLFLPFSPTCLKKGDKFQAILYYTWENSIIASTDSTSYFTLTLFPKGVKKLITNLIFTSNPTQVAVYKVNKKRKSLLSKELFSKVTNIKQTDDSFVIRWEIDEPKDTYILQRTLEEWN